MAPAIPSNFHNLFMHLEELISPKKESAFKPNNYIATPYCLPTCMPELTLVSIKKHLIIALFRKLVEVWTLDTGLDSGHWTGLQI